MDDKYEEIVILEIDHISNDGQSIIQSKKQKVSDESKAADHKKVELGKVRFIRKLVSSTSDAMPSSPETVHKKWKYSRNKSQDQGNDALSPLPNKENQKTKRSNFFCCRDCDSSENVKEEQTSKNSEGPQDWQIREWNAELRENYICMNELNLKQKTEKLKKEFELIEAERVRKEAAIQEKEKEVIIRKRSLERKEIEIEEKNKLLEIAIRVNEISLESQVGDLEQKSDVTRQTSGMVTRRTYYTPVGNKNSEIDLNGVEPGDNSTEGSDETNSPSSH